MFTEGVRFPRADLGASSAQAPVGSPLSRSPAGQGKLRERETSHEENAAAFSRSLSPSVNINSFTLQKTSLTFLHQLIITVLDG